MTGRHIKIFVLIVMGLGAGAFSYYAVKGAAVKNEISRLEETLKHSPERIEEKHRLGLLYMYEGDLKNAEEEFLGILSIDPYSTKALRSAGMVYYRMGEPHKALTYWRTLLEIEPDNRFIWNLVNELNKERGSAAIRHEEAQPVSPQWEYYYTRGQENYHKKNFREAAEEFKKASEFNPADFRTYFNIGASHYAMGDVRKAKEYWDMTLKYKKDDIMTMRLLSLAEREIDVEEKIEDTKKRLEKEPSNWGLHLTLADAYAKNKHTTRDAKKEYLKALGLNPAYIPIYDRLVELYVKLDEYDEALEVAGKRPPAIGMEEERHKDRMDALLAYKKFIDKGKKDWEAKGINRYGEMLPVLNGNTTEFYMDKHEVTNARYRAFLKATGHNPPPGWSDAPVKGKENYPVTSVSWYDATLYCRWAARRLPTEKEWIKAGWAEDGKGYPWGGNFSADMANTSLSGFERPTPAGSYNSNRGVYDMVGNVLEWTSDEKINESTGKTYKIRKGGSFLSDPSSIRPETRWPAPATFMDNSTGFRCAKSAGE